jgi:hypothetical protein
VKTYSAVGQGTEIVMRTPRIPQPPQQPVVTNWLAQRQHEATSWRRVELEPRPSEI